MVSLTGEAIDRKELLKWGHVRFLETKALIKIGENSKMVTRGVVEGPDGANVLPYFIEDGKCYIILVAQFRHAVESVTWEAPGGVIGPMGITESMAKELEEEAGIKVRPENIQVIFKEYLLPSLTSAFGWGGIVRINRADIPSERLRGVPCEGEFTLLIITPLAELIIAVQGQLIILDLWTSRLINELTRMVGA